MPRWVITADLHLGDHRGHRFVDAHFAEVVVQILLQGVADGSLGVGTTHVQRHFVQLVGGQFGAAQDEPYLRAVAVADGHLPASLDHLGDVISRLAGGHILVFNRSVRLVFDQGVTPDGHNRDLAFVLCHRFLLVGGSIMTPG